MEIDQLKDQNKKVEAIVFRDRSVWAWFSPAYYKLKQGVVSHLARNCQIMSATFDCGLQIVRRAFRITPSSRPSKTASNPLNLMVKYTLEK